MQGTCLSYNQVLQVDTTLAESTTAVIPTNLTRNQFIHYTADNIDIIDLMLDGKNTFHATQLASWQRGESNDITLQTLDTSSAHVLNVPNIL